jgi:prolyl 4-hydroxylase
MNGCEENPIVKNLTQRIADLVGIKTKHFESFQVLRYEVSQKYDVHHGMFSFLPLVQELIRPNNNEKDSTQADFNMVAGPRVLTFYMYLSDVDEGGGTHFPRLNLTVTPRKGSAVLWPSVTNDHPDSEIEPMTYHAALPVIKG